MSTAVAPEHLPSWIAESSLFDPPFSIVHKFESA
jgi:hypothetical protein